MILNLAGAVMKFIFKQNNIYYFRRKIPKTSYNFTFSLKTKNSKTALNKASIFLRLCEHIFLELKYLPKEEIMANINEIQKIFSDYKKRALEEYSDIEEARHNHFTCKSKGEEFDGGYPKCIKKWLKTIKKMVFRRQNDEYIELFEKIFERTGIDRNFYENLNEAEKKAFRAELLKTESKILRTDYERAENRFGTETVNVSYLEEEHKIPTKQNKYYEKTAEEIANDFYSIKRNDTKEMHKYTEPIKVFLQVVNKKYLIDITTEDIQDFVFTIKNMPPKTNKANIELLEKYKDNYFELAKIVDSKSYEKISLKTALSKISRVTMFLDYAVESERLDKNRLKNKFVTPSKTEIIKVLDKEEKPREMFSDDELYRLFNSSSWYTTRLKKYMNGGEDRIFIPLIGLFAGMRVTEASQLYLNDIIEEQGIYYFRVDNTNPNQRLKTLNSRRIIPIHSMLIDLGFLKYIEKLKKEKHERVFPQLYHTKDKGYGQAFSKKFNNLNFKKEWIDKERIKKLEEKEIKVDFHSFRHTFTTKLMGRVEDSMVNKLLGHKGSTESQRTYNHNYIKSLKESIEKLDIDRDMFKNLLDKIGV